MCVEKWTKPIHGISGQFIRGANCRRDQGLVRDLQSDNIRSYRGSKREEGDGPALGCVVE
jgi:hypothetical protein